MGGIGQMATQALQGIPQSLLSGQGIVGSIASAINPVLGGIWDTGTALAGATLLGSGLGGGGGGLFGGGGSGVGPAGSAPFPGAAGLSPSQASLMGAASPVASAGSPLNPPSAMGDMMASVNPGFGAPASTMLSPSGGGAAPVGAATLSPLGGGPAPTSTPAQPQGPSALSSAFGASGSASQAYANYLTEVERLKYSPTYAATHSSSVAAPTFNPLAPVQSSPISPPQLTV